MHRNQSVNVHQFAMVPKADIPRSSFRMQKALKTAFDSGYLVPILCEEVLPGDTFNCRMTAFCRLATPIFPIMDNLWLETFFFYVPNRLLWSNWTRFMGEQISPADSISFSVPQTVSPASGFPIGTIFDYFGLPTVGQVGAGNTVSVSALPLRAYNRIWHEWFKDENLQNAITGFSAYPGAPGDGPDASTNFTLKRRGKRHDYFTSCLPWTQKGGVAVTLPLGTSAPVKGLAQAKDVMSALGGTSFGRVRQREAGSLTGDPGSLGSSAPPAGAGDRDAIVEVDFADAGTTAYADLSAATAATINQLRQAFQIQRLLERDARGGTRYTEIVRSHFGVVSPDARLQRSEYLGGGKSPVIINPIAQTSETAATPQGNLAAMGTALAQGHGFTQSFTEHGYIIGIANVFADLTYQQGLRKHWSRLTRYDFYFPVFANLGEQAVLNKEIYCVGNGGAGDDLVFGYQERWAEYRYNPSEITGLMRSTAAGTIDAWHLSQRFTALPTLNSTFIEETPPLSRVLAVGTGANGQQLLMDAFYDIKAARPLPMYSVPGMIDHF